MMADKKYARLPASAELVRELRRLKGIHNCLSYEDLIWKLIRGELK